MNALCVSIFLLLLYSIIITDSVQDMQIRYIANNGKNSSSCSNSNSSSSSSSSSSSIDDIDDDNDDDDDDIKTNVS